LKPIDLCLGLASVAKGGSAGQEAGANGCKGFEWAHWFEVGHGFENGFGLHSQQVVTNIMF
jgi:hypothetical protein